MAPLLLTLLLLLGAAVVMVSLSRRFGFGSILGYLVGGALVGPSGLRLVTDVQSIAEISELGVLMLLFIIGLELQPTRLWVMRRNVFGLGSAQVILCAVLLGVTGWLIGLRVAPALLVGFGLSLSSTPLVLQLLAERSQLKSPHGRAAFGILLFQDLAVLPVLAALPLIRAQFCELLAPCARIPDAANDLFLLGLLSAMDAILDMRMPDVLKEIAIGEEIRNALLGKSNALRRILDVVLNYERGNWDEISQAAANLGVRDEVITERYLESVDWAQQVVSGHNASDLNPAPETPLHA